MWAALGLQLGVDLHGDRAGKAALDAGHGQRLQHTQTACRQIACNAPHAQGVGAVRGDLHFDHRITDSRAVGGQPIGELVAHLTRGKLDNAVVLVRQLQLALGRHHPVAFHAANFAHAQGHINARHIIARLAQHHRDSGPRIGCSADNLLFALIRHHAAHAQPVGIGVLGGLQNLGDGERGQFRHRVDHLFDLKPKIGQRIEDLIQRRRRLKVIFQPRQGEFHRTGPFRSVIRSLAPGLAQSLAKGKHRGSHWASGFRMGNRLSRITCLICLNSANHSV